MNRILRSIFFSGAYLYTFYSKRNPIIGAVGNCAPIGKSTTYLALAVKNTARMGKSVQMQSLAITVTGFGNKGRNGLLMVLQVRPTPTWFLTNIFYTPVGCAPLHSILSW